MSWTSTGTLAGEAGSTIRASDSITLDATGRNAFAGTTAFADRSGNPVAGNFSVGATRVNFGNAPVGAEGLTLSQGELNALDALKSVTLTSYSTFDLYGDVSIGGENDQGKPTLQALTLTGAGLAGLQNAGKTATLRAGNILFSNPAASPFTAGGTPGTGSVAIYADKLMLGDGIKAIQGFSQVSVNANELIGRESGSMDNAGAASLNVRASAASRVAAIRERPWTLTASKATGPRTLRSITGGDGGPCRPPP
jgi:hypothetical protein